METIKKFFKYSIFLVLTVVAVFIFLVNFSVVEYKYKCKQTYHPFLKYHFMYSDYRFWVNLWSSSDGRLAVESRNGDLNYLNNVKESSESIYSIEDDQYFKFSKISNKLIYKDNDKYNTLECVEIK